MIKNIIFDIGGVLVDFHPDKVLVQHNITGEKLKAILNATVLSDVWCEADRGVMEESEVIGLMKQNVSKDLWCDIDWFFAEGIKNVVSPYEYAVDWVKSLREKGYKIYILSNYPERAFEMHSKPFFPFLDYTDGKIVSGFVKLIKPDPRIYQCLLQTYHLKADECAFIDDIEKNVAVANALGIHAIQFTTYDETSRKLNEMLTN